MMSQKNVDNIFVIYLINMGSFPTRPICPLAYFGRLYIYLRSNFFPDLVNSFVLSFDHTKCVLWWPTAGSKEGKL